ncbi:metal ABC transporter ATP-binding protein [Sulfurimonas sp.]|uniref:metal ABC transporter ATP-binding protein n=1 Tax=Sulfurimonas sp. TaxID=2022749 RepID=UPI003D11C6C4
MQINKHLIEIESLSFKHKQESILEDINLCVDEKDFLALIGPNGGGKTTLLKLILGLYKAQSGSIKIYSDTIAYVPQNTNININFPIKAIEVVMMGDLSNKSRANAMDVLKQVGMQNFADKKIGSLSGGQRQRVMIARALFANPQILLLDEPTSNIDVNGQKQIYDLLKKLNKYITIIVVSHDLSVVLQYANKVAHINKTLTFHDISSLQQNLHTSPNHFCEVELLEMMQGYK